MYPINETLSVGEVVTINMQGRYFEITDLTGSVDVEMSTREGRTVARGLHVLAGTYFHPKETFHTIQLTNRSGAATTIKAFVGDGEAGTTRTTGTVEVSNNITPAIDEAIKLKRFWQYANSGAVAGQYSRISLAGSPGKIFCCTKIVVRPGAASTVYMTKTSTNPFATVLVGNLVNEVGGGPVSGAAVWTGANAAIPGTLGMHDADCTASNLTQVIDLSGHPMALADGRFITMSCGLANTALNASFYGYEA